MEVETYILKTKNTNKLSKANLLITCNINTLISVDV